MPSYVLFYLVGFTSNVNVNFFSLSLTLNAFFVRSSEMLDAAAYQRLTRKLPPPQAAITRQIYQQEQSHISCLKGIYTLITGEKPLVPPPAVSDDPPEITLRRCYGREMRCLSQYESRMGDPQYGHIFRSLARQEQEHCRRILEILGNLPK